MSTCPGFAPAPDFVACDNATANRLTIRTLAAVAEAEGRRISERTKAALAAASEPLYSEVKPIIASMKAHGPSLQTIANRLNTDGHTTLRGLPWNKMQVSRLLS